MTGIFPGMHAGEPIRRAGGAMHAARCMRRVVRRHYTIMEPATGSGGEDGGQYMSDDAYQAAHPGAISFDDFAKVEVRVGRILTAAPLDGARKPAYKLSIDFGPALGVKQSS